MTERFAASEGSPRLGDARSSGVQGPHATTSRSNDSAPLHDGQPAIAVEGVAKRFGHVEALRGVDLAVHRGEIVALLGDNGAGKSTLLEIMCGALRADEGRLLVNGTGVASPSPLELQRRGVDAVHQDLALAPDLRIYESVYIGKELTGHGLLRRRQMRSGAAEALRHLELQVPSLDTRVRELSGGQRQALAISRAVIWSKTALLLDEPTAALGARRTEIVLDLIRKVARAGLGVLLVTHDLTRVLGIADRVAVLWRGELVLLRHAHGLTTDQVIAATMGHVDHERE
jgi:simple sugar transport system ATP-binding protein